MQSLSPRDVSNRLEWRSLSAGSFVVRYTIFVVCIIAFLSGIAFLSNMNQKFADDISWGRTAVPELPASFGKFTNMSHDSRFLLAVLGMKAEFPYLGSSRLRPTATVPKDQDVVIVGRFGSKEDSSYAILATATGIFNQKCVIQAGGMLTGMAHDHDKALVVYQPPAGGKTGFGTCHGNEIFFMPWGNV